VRNPQTARPGYRSISSPNGYRLQIPADWQEREAQPGIDLAFASPRRSGNAYISVIEVQSASPEEFLIEYQRRERRGDPTFVTGAPTQTRLLGAERAHAAVATSEGAGGTRWGELLIAAARGTRLYALHLCFTSRYCDQYDDELAWIGASFALTGPR